VKAIYDVYKKLTARSLKYNIKETILNAKHNVKAIDEIENYEMLTNDLTYHKLEEKMTSQGKTFLNIKNEYDIESKDLLFMIEENYISSKNKSKIIDNKNQVYFLKKFKYLINQEILKAEDLLVITNYNLAKSDQFFFSNAIINLKNKKFFGSDVEIDIHKNIFGEPKNDPRLKGVSAIGDSNKTLINKGIFTSCKKDDKCPPWSIKSAKIIHDREKKQLIYENAILNIYDLPILYFPKFFHPDPTVNRQSGFLKPQINNSNILGSSISVPYYKVISENKDLTLTPVIFDSDTKIIQTEYRQENKNSSFIADLGYVNKFKSSSKNTTKNLSHFFGKFDLDLSMRNFEKSNLSAKFERVSSDTYLKIFENHITYEKKIKPGNFDKLTNNLNLSLINEGFSFDSGISSYETLSGKSSDRYQYILPYYNLNKSIGKNYFNGSLYFSSSGSNELKSTNQLDTSIINDINYDSVEYISNNGLTKNYRISLKNSNVIGKKSSKYKSSPQSELTSLFNAEVALPLVKENKSHKNLLIPKLSFRFNPTDMKNYSSSSNNVNINNIFSDNRLGLSDTFEAGRSLTLGLNYRRDQKVLDLDYERDQKKTNIDDINNFFEFKIATVLRDKEENMVSKKSTLNKKNSNLFGSLNSKITDHIKFDYNFSIDNDYSTFERNDMKLTFSNNNLITTFAFVEENGEIGDTNIFENSVTYKYNERNSLTFNTRRNRKINLTEYYDLVYEYKYDCLRAGIKYNKKYYSDGDLKPVENLMFTVTLFPLTNYEYNAKDLLNN
ncbi:LPS-assembly protein LptD, partial [Candidatus Pelagibacter sp. HIMB1521]|uniref:LPS-assembly protein LptD n=1 Tax=Candidatus Pelagibacter sp. HIMB1521 TaxID=3413344 RepID=UPI003F857CE5